MKRSSIRLSVHPSVQDRRKEVKWGEVVKVENGGVFLFSKVENWVFCKKNGKWVFFCKKVDLSSTQGALCTVSVFILHLT